MSATIAQPLTQLHEIGLGTKLNETSREVEREKLREERAAVAAEVRRVYYGIVHAESALAAAEEQVSVYRELDRVVGEQVVLEVALRSDGLEVKSRLAAEEYELARLRGELDSGKERMKHLLGRDLAHVLAKVEAFGRSLPPGTKLEIGGEYEKQMEGFGELTVVMAISVIMIFLALVLPSRVRPTGSVPCEDGFTRVLGSRHASSARRSRLARDDHDRAEVNTCPRPCRPPEGPTASRTTPSRTGPTRSSSSRGASASRRRSRESSTS